MDVIIVIVLLYFGWKILIKVAKYAWHLLSFGFVREFLSNLKVNKAYPLLLKFSKEQELFNRNDFQDYLEDHDIFLNREEITKSIILLLERDKIRPFGNMKETWKSTHQGTFKNPVEKVVISLD